MRKNLPVLLVSALTALLMSIVVQVVPQASATLVANQANYRRTGNNPFTSGGTLTHTDLNNNFDAVVTVVDGNIDATNIVASVQRLWPRAWARVTCAPSSCTVNDQQGVTSVSYTSAGEYLLTLTTARTNTVYAPICSASTSTSNVFCQCEPSTSSVVQVSCQNDAGTASDVVFHMMIFDS